MPYQIPMRNEDRYLFDANIGGQESSVLVWTNQVTAIGI